MERPWMKFRTRDWLDNKELRRCSPVARSVLIDLMALGHEGVPYGFLADKSGALSDAFMASRCVMTVGKFRVAVKELELYTRVHRKDGVLLISQMVEDERRRLSSQENGSKGGNPWLTNSVNRISKHDGLDSSRATCSGSDSDSGSIVQGGGAGEPMGDDPIVQIQLWLHQFVEKFGIHWPMPDLAICFNVFRALNGASVDDLEKLLQELWAKKQRPRQGYAWFVTVVKARFEDWHAA